MRPQPKFEKMVEVSQLKRGDILKLITGEIVEFQSMKQKNFTGLINNKLYNIPINMFGSLVEKAIKNDKTDEIKSLKNGDLFYIIKKDNAVVFIFNYIQGNTIFATNPVNNGGVRMDINMFSGKIDTLMSQQVMKKLV